MHLIHLWRAFAFRGLGYYARAVKSLSVRVPLFLGCCLRYSWGDIYRLVAVPLWNFYEEDVVTTYWRSVYSVVSSQTRLYKVSWEKLKCIGQRRRHLAEQSTLMKSYSHTQVSIQIEYLRSRINSPTQSRNENCSSLGMMKIKGFYFFFFYLPDCYASKAPVIKPFISAEHPEIKDLTAT